MADRGITFSAPMVRALLDGRKTQTRRLISPTKKDIAPGQILRFEGPRIGGRAYRFAPPHQPGDRLYVREHWKTTPAYDDLAPRDMGGEEPLRYLADDATFNWAEADGALAGRHRQAMHMPRWASRLTLLVTDVRVQRLQEIGEADALAEGIVEHEATMTEPAEYTIGPDSLLYSNAVEAYAALWDSLHTDPGTRWEDNPWIYAVSFDVRRGNIDNLEGAN